MKKIFLYLAVVGMGFVAGNVLVSCNKEKLSKTGAVEEGEVMEIEMSIDVASIPAPEEDTKVNVAKTTGKVTWTAGDQVAVYNTSGTKYVFTLSAGAGTGTGTFTGTLSGIAKLAVYPADYASSTMGTVTLPATIDYTSPTTVPVVLAGLCSTINSKVIMTLKAISGVYEFNMQNIPAYARCMRVFSASKALSGDFTFNTTTPTSLASKSGNSSNGVLFRFPNKTGYGTTIKFYVPIPVSDYTDIAIRFIDGGSENIEGIDNLAIPAKSAKMSAGKYVAMPVLNVGSKCTRATNIRRVNGVSWATGNLQHVSGKTGNGFQTNWSLADNQWEFLGWDSLDASGKSATYTQDQNNFDRFCWGATGDNARLGGNMTGLTGRQIITSKIYSDKAGTNQKTGDARFGTETLYGDTAFWASKGQWSLADASTMNNLANKASWKSGYVIKNDHKVFGVLFYDKAAWESQETNGTPQELSDADLEYGLFLPKVGRRQTTSTNGNTISFVDGQGYYWTGRYNGTADGVIAGDPYKTSVYCFGMRAYNSGGTTEEKKQPIDKTYQVTINDDKTAGKSSTDVTAGMAIRPFKIGTYVPDPEVTPTEKSLAPWTAGQLDIHIINAGRGECIFIIYPDGTTMCIDAGEYGGESAAHGGSGTYVLRKPYDLTSESPTGKLIRVYKVYTAYMKYMMKNNGHNYLDYFLLTHFHQDHAGAASSSYELAGDGYIASGPSAIYEDLPIKKIVTRTAPDASLPISHKEGDVNDNLVANFYQFAKYRQNSDGMEWYKINTTTARDNQFPAKYGGNVTMETVIANENYWNGSGWTSKASGYENNKSIGTKLTWGTFNAYFGADCGDQNGILAAASSYIGKVELFKGSHHLATDGVVSSTAVSRLQPKVTIACILNNERPDATVLSNLKTYGTVFDTNNEYNNLDTDHGGHICVRVTDNAGTKTFKVYMIKDTDFSYEVRATYGPYSCY